METLSVVVVNWNAGGALGRCLASIYASTPWSGALEVLLVDNASTDRSQTRAAREYPGLKVLQNAENRGFARGVNQGLAQATGELILLLNPDVVLAPSTISLLADFMTQHPSAAVVGPKLLNADGTVQASARRDPSPWTGLFGRDAPLTRLFPNNPVSRRELPALEHAGAGPLEVDWISGACLLVRRAAYERVGLMDERFFLFWEDADWCLRFRRAGWKVHYLPSAVGTHRVGVSRARRPIRSAIDFHRSAYRFYRKHHLSSPLHPMMIPLVGGLLVSFGIRALRAALTRR
jgi:N-acetylglucosaminyl-diphospho-decaprenol L-rhamnosyltransferase